MTTTTTPPQTSTPESIVDVMLERFDQRSRDRVQKSPRNQPWASDMDPASCLRRQVLEIVEWEASPPIPAERQPRLETGEVIESRAIVILKELGFRVVKEQMATELRSRQDGKVIVRGKTDAFVVFAGEEIPVEVKSVEPFVFDAIETAEDFDRFWWMRRYVPQMTVYLIGYGRPFGVILLVDLRGRWKPIGVSLDYDLAEAILQMAETIVEHADRYRQARASSGDAAAVATLPAFTKNLTLCARCPFFGKVCQPPVHEAGALVIEDPDLELNLLRWRDLRPAAKEYEGLDKRIKDRLKRGPERQMIGPAMVTLKKYPKKEVILPATTVTRCDIEFTDRPSGEGD